MMCPTFYESFCGALFKKRPASFLFACLFDRNSNGNGHTKPEGLLPAPMSPIISTLQGLSP